MENTQVTLTLPHLFALVASTVNRNSTEVISAYTGIVSVAGYDDCVTALRNVASSALNNGHKLVAEGTEVAVTEKVYDSATREYNTRVTTTRIVSLTATVEAVPNQRAKA
jgi:hypothetical protein